MVGGLLNRLLLWRLGSTMGQQRVLPEQEALSLGALRPEELTRGPARGVNKVEPVKVRDVVYP